MLYYYHCKLRLCFLHYLGIIIVSLSSFACKTDPKTESAAVPDAWYRNSIIYNVDVDNFKDSVVMALAISAG